MRLSSAFIVLLTFFLAGGLCLVAASFAVNAIEDGSEIGIRQSLDAADHDWAEVEANGLQVTLSGTAPDEAKRIHALSIVGGVVDAARVINVMEVAPGADLAAPKFSAEILRNESGISIVGLIPAETDRVALIDKLNQIDGPAKVADLLETAMYPAPPGWDDALAFAVTVLTKLPRSKVSVDAGRIAITAISASPQAKRALETELTSAAPPGLRMSLSIAAPRPVVTPFSLRFLIDEAGARFDACSAESETSRDRILAAARVAGLPGPGQCTVAMGVPSPKWSEAAQAAIAALAELGQGSVTFSDADITLVTAPGTDAILFDRVVGELETALPDVFALHAVQPVAKNDEKAGPPEFVATLSPEGLVQLRGRVTDESLRSIADSYARALFGSDSVYTATRIVADLPPDWSVRVLSGLEALSLLANGVVTVTPDHLTLRGTSSQEDANAKIAGLLSDKLGESQTYNLEITYRAPPPPEFEPPDPDVCEAELDAAQDGGKINFEPGSATIDASSLDTMDTIAEILNQCGEIRLEIQGHTDSQGREVMNQQLSQARAQSVLNELRARRVLTATYVAVGYGEAAPIADNGTEEGREDNRRIEFRLIRSEPVAEVVTTLEKSETDNAGAVDDESENTENTDTATEPSDKEEQPSE